MQIIWSLLLPDTQAIEPKGLIMHIDIILNFVNHLKHTKQYRKAKNDG